MEVLEDIPVSLELDDVLKKLRTPNRNEYFREIIQELFDMIRPIAKPKAVYEISQVDNRQGDSLDIGGVRFTSHVLRVNLDELKTVFPFIVTCGSELDEIEIPKHYLMKCYLLDQIKEVIALSALGYLHDYVRENRAC